MTISEKSEFPSSAGPWRYFSHHFFRKNEAKNRHHSRGRFTNIVVRNDKDTRCVIGEDGAVWVWGVSVSKVLMLHRPLFNH